MEKNIYIYIYIYSIQDIIWGVKILHNTVYLDKKESSRLTLINKILLALMICRYQRRRFFNFNLRFSEVVEVSRSKSQDKNFFTIS